MKPIVWLILLSSFLSNVFSDTPIAPRTQVSDYPAYTKHDIVDMGAALLTSEQVRKSFVSDLNRRYIVVEVAIYPKDGKEFDVARHRFTLRVDNTLVRPAEPKIIADLLQKTASPKRQVNVYPHAGVGYESGSIYDPVTGRRRGGGVYTNVGVGVGVGGSQTPPVTEEDRKTMETELTDKSLAEGKTSKPIAGYLYFPVSEKKKASYQLEHDLNGEKVVLKLVR